MFTTCFQISWTNILFLDQKETDVDVIQGFEAMSKQRAEDSYNTIVLLNKFIYATESHIVWIESMQDLISRKNEMSDKLSKLHTDIRKRNVTSYEVDTQKYLLSLTERREAIVRGVKEEINLFKIGNNDYYDRWVHSGFIMDQLNFYAREYDIMT